MNSLLSSKRISYPNLVNMFQQRVAEDPDRMAFRYLVDGEQEEIIISFAELDMQARAIANRLHERNAEGERVLLLYAPGVEYIAAFWGCLYAGAVAVPTYPPDVTRIERSMPRFLAIVNDSQPLLALTTRPILNMAQMLLAQYPDLQKFDWLATDEITGDGSVLEDEASGWSEPALSGETMAFLQYTSGSTAAPKGVMLTHMNLLHNLEAIRDGFEIVEREPAVFWLPFYHDMGLIGGILATTYCNLPVTLMSPMDFLQRPLRWLQAISRTGAAISGGPNFAYDLCVRKVTDEQKVKLDLSSWSLAFNGAEPIRSGTINRFSETFSECGFRKEAFYPCYGLAESTLFVTGIRRSENPLVQSFRASELANERVVEYSHIPAERTPGGAVESRTLVGCGWSFLDNQVVIVDPDDLTPCTVDELGTPVIGEIWVSGPSVASGYWNRPDETRSTYKAHLPGDPDKNYLRTGDLGFIKNGQLFIAGRLKDLIIIDGLNHYPQDIELTVEQCHPAIRPGCSAAFSVEVKNREQIVVVTEIAKQRKLETLKEDSDISLDSRFIKNSIRSAVTKQHDIGVHEILLLKPGGVPKTSSGKIQRHACKEGYLAGSHDIWEG